MSGRQNPSRDWEGDRAAKRRGGGGSASLRRSEVYEARKLRREMSLPEVLLWQRLKGSPQGVDFRKQHPTGAYKADFYCPASRLVIGVDGEAHNRGDRPARDENRSAFLAEHGCHLLRIDAATILTNADEAANSVVVYARSPLHHPRKSGDGHPPRPGEDLRS